MDRRFNPLQRAFLEQNESENGDNKQNSFLKPRVPVPVPTQQSRFRKPKITQTLTTPGGAETHSSAPGVARQPGCSTLPVPVPAPAALQTSSSKISPGAAQKRNKVVLQPGHGPLDWADLQAKKGSTGETTMPALISIRDWSTFTRDNEVYEHNLIPVLKQLAETHSVTSPPPAQVLTRYPPILPWEFKPALKIRLEEVQKHNTRNDMWCVLNGKVYFLSRYLDFHPGGQDILMKYCNGKIATVMFNKYHRWVNYEKLLQTFYLGDLLSA
ncbi:hypothetical protein ACO0QE_000109 [Hanseniaspora vineae]